MEQHSMDLTKETEEYRLHKTHTPAARQKAAAAALVARTRNHEEDGVCCHLYVPSRSTLFMGCLSGLLLLFKPKNEFHAEIVRSELGVGAGGHRGQIFDLIFLAEGDWAGAGAGSGAGATGGGAAHGSSPHALLATASADRTVKLWDVFERDLRCRCVQTLVGHSGSVTSLSFLRGALVTASTDGSIRVWRSAPDRSLLLYPFFECVQELWAAPTPVPNSVLSAGMNMMGSGAEAMSPQAPGKKTGRSAGGTSGGAGGGGALGSTGAGAESGLSGLGNSGGSGGGGSNAPVLKACPYVVGRLIRAETQLLFVGDAQGRVYTFTPPQRGSFGAATLQLSASQAPSALPTSLASVATANGSASVFSFKHSRAGSVGGANGNLSAHPSRPQSSSSGATGAGAATGSASSLHHSHQHHHRPSGSIHSIPSALSHASSLAGGSGSSFVNPSASSGALGGGGGGGSGGGGSSSGSVASLEFVRSHKMHALSVSHLLLVASESLLITLSFDHTVQVHDALTGSGLFGIENPTRCRFLCAAWDSAAAELFLADEKGYLQVWNVFVEKCVKSVRLKEGPITSLSIHSAPAGSGAGSNTTKLLLGTSAGVEVWTVSRGVLFNEFKGHDAPIVALVQVETRSISRVDLGKLGHPDPAGRDAAGEAAPGGAAAASGALSARLGLGPVLSGGGRHRSRTSPPSKARGPPQLTSIVSSEKHLYSCSLDHTIRQWDCYDMGCLSVIKERRSELSCMVHLPASIILCTGHDDGTIRMWNIDSGTYMNLLHHRNTVSCLVVAKTPRQDCLISGSFDGTIAVWDVTRTRVFQAVPEYTLRVSQEEVLCAAFHPQLGMIFTAGNDGLICMWNIESRAREAVFKGHKNAVGCLALDGNFLISGSDDASIIVWNIHLSFPVAVLRGHELAVRDLVVLPRVGLVVSCAFDGRVIVWDYQRAAPVDAANAAEEEERRQRDAQAKARAQMQAQQAAQGASAALKHSKHRGGGTSSLSPPPPPAPPSQSAWVDTGMGAPVHQFHHGDKRFRCLLYDSDQRKIFAGTEEARIMFFILPEELFPASMTAKKAEGGADGTQHTPRTRRAKRAHAPPPPPQQQQHSQQHRAQESKEDSFSESAGAAGAGGDGAAVVPPALTPGAGMGSAATSALGESIAALSLTQSKSGLAGPHGHLVHSGSSSRARSLASSHTASTATLLPGGGVGLLLPDGSVPTGGGEGGGAGIGEEGGGSSHSSASQTPRHAGGAASSSSSFSSVVDPDVYVDFSGIVRELTSRSLEIQQLLATVKPMPVRPPAPPQPSLAAMLASGGTQSAAAAAAGGDDARPGGAARGSATFLKVGAAGGGSAAASALKRMSFAPAVAAPSQARRASLNSAAAHAGVAALLRANAAATSTAAASASASIDAEEKDDGPALAASMLINRGSAPGTNSSSPGASQAPSSLSSPLASSAGSSGGGSSKFASSRPSARPSARTSARASLVRDSASALQQTQQTHGLTPPRQGGLLSPSASLSTLLVPGQSAVTQPQPPQLQQQQQQPSSTSAPATDSNAISLAAPESPSSASARARLQRRSSVTASQVAAAMAAAHLSALPASADGGSPRPAAAPASDARADPSESEPALASAEAGSARASVGL